MEINKIVALAGAIPFIPTLPGALGIGSHDQKMELLHVSTSALWGHSVYSAFKFYDSKHIPSASKWRVALLDLFSTKSKARVEALRVYSLLAGVSGQVLITSVFYGYAALGVSIMTIACAGVFFGLVHFYSMEVDFKGVLQVRPFAYLAVVLPIVAVGAHALSQLQQ